MEKNQNLEYVHNHFIQEKASAIDLISIIVFIHSNSEEAEYRKPNEKYVSTIKYFNCDHHWNHI